MTYEEAKALCGIVSYADGGCSYCVSDLMDGIAKQWPDIDWRKAFEEGTDKYGGKWKVRAADHVPAQQVKP